MLKDVSGVWNLSDLTDATSLLLLMSMVKVTNNMQSKKGREEGGGGEWSHWCNVTVTPGVKSQGNKPCNGDWIGDVLWQLLLTLTIQYTYMQMKTEKHSTYTLFSLWVYKEWNNQNIRMLENIIDFPEELVELGRTVVWDGGARVHAVGPTPKQNCWHKKRRGEIPYNQNV